MRQKAQIQKKLAVEKKMISDSDGQLSDDLRVRSPSNTLRTDTSVHSKTAKKMFNQETQKMLVKDVRIDKFQGRDHDDISRDGRTPN